MSVLSKNDREFIELLEKHQVKYLLVGGHAVARHGYIRYTTDIDFFVKKTLENSRQLTKVLIEFGFTDSKLTEDIFLSEKQIYEIGHGTNMLQVFTNLPGVEFDECYEHRVFATIDNLTIPIIGIDELIKNKEATGRDKDRTDVEQLRKIKTALKIKPPSPPQPKARRHFSR